MTDEKKRTVPVVGEVGDGDQVKWYGPPAGAWEFACEGCRRVTPESPTCSVCGAMFAFADPRETAKKLAELGVAGYIESLGRKNRR